MQVAVCKRVAGSCSKILDFVDGLDDIKENRQIAVKMEEDILPEFGCGGKFCDFDLLA